MHHDPARGPDGRHSGRARPDHDASGHAVTGPIPVTTMAGRIRGDPRFESGEPSCASPTCDLDTRTSDRRRTDPLRPDASCPPTQAPTQPHWPTDPHLPRHEPYASLR